MSEENKSFAVGHLAIGYVFSKISAKPFKIKPNLPLLFTLSVIPDIDLLFPSLLEHRGPLHSILVSVAVFVPFFALYRKMAVPYFVALIQHSLIGDYITGGGTQLLWPLTTQYFGTNIDIRSSTSVGLEWAVFLFSLLTLFAAKDFGTFFQARKSNLILAIPTFTVLLPSFLSYPLQVPILLIPPHLAYLALFSASIVIVFYCFLK